MQAFRRALPTLQRAQRSSRTYATASDTYKVTNCERILPPISMIGVILMELGCYSESEDKWRYKSHLSGLHGQAGNFPRGAGH